MRCLRNEARAKRLGFFANRASSQGGRGLPQSMAGCAHRGFPREAKKEEPCGFPRTALQPPKNFVDQELRRRRRTMRAVSEPAKSAQVFGSGMTVNPRTPSLWVNVHVSLPLVRPQTSKPLSTSVPV